ncbi:hypothetical protein A1O3_09339 [Capronia epimyces CBS 606.96]|uniref:Major facilitator superfamily (MFS) profile domain-containing protein n=1 Tax=Capronia epimyces CBS 606.96 TaxID=1182542 RepID=W9XD85_9EURO|nr:uncharacterized protein A1O3_09339 [Capronia epimyces CBS 606.96]EXJ78178.1 hypothetical protein A1O3_09339 [Capronia epimyces CBS 606.96]
MAELPTEKITLKSRLQVQSEAATSDAPDPDIQPGSTAATAAALDAIHLAPGYYTSFRFLGSALAVGLGFGCGVGGYSLIAPILSYIDADIGPDANIVWVSLVYTLTSAIGLLLFGRLSDLFGRRWFFVGGSALALVGSIVCATANSIPMLIGGETLLGFASASQLSYGFTLGELLPIKYRFLGVSYCYLFVIPFSALGPGVAYALILHTAAGWRWCYYLLIITNTICTLCWYFCYYPPTFQAKNGDQTFWHKLAQLDYLGLLLYTGGLLLFLMGLSWGGSVHPWRSAYVICTMVIGLLMLVGFVLWEAWATLQEPMLPLHLFKQRGFASAVLMVSIGASVYYAFAILWPNMVNILYSEGETTMWIGWASCTTNAGFTLGEICGGVLAKVFKKVKYQLICATVSSAALLAAVASCTPHTKDRAIGLIFVGTLLVGWYESISFTLTTVLVDDQTEVGTAAGLGGSARSGISTVCSVIYTVVLSNRLASTVPAQVVPAVTAAGLPASSVASFLTALTAGTPDAYAKIPGITNAILAAGQQAYKTANADAYRTVSLTTLAFGGLAIIASLFMGEVESRMTGEVTAKLHLRKEKEATSAETAAV